MATKCKKYDINGSEVEEVELSLPEWKETNTQMIKDYIVALRKNARQWSANTKGRSESHHSGAKPHAQKGTGRARQGFLGAPQYKGGGRVFTPKPKFDQHVRINRKERRKAIMALLADKIENGKLIFLRNEFKEHFKKPHTKKAAHFFKQVGIDRSCLVIDGGDLQEGAAEFRLSCRNIPYTTYHRAENINGYSLIAHQNVVVIDSALPSLEKVLRG